MGGGDKGCVEGRKADMWWQPLPKGLEAGTGKTGNPALNMRGFASGRGLLGDGFTGVVVGYIPVRASMLNPGNEEINYYYLPATW